MKAVFLDFATLGRGIDVSRLRSAFSELALHDNTPAEDVAERVHNAEFVLANKVRFDEALLRDNPNIRFIGLVATGTDNVDLDAAKRHGVAVCNIRAYCTNSMAEHVFGCLLNLSHNLSNYNDTVRAGAWQSADHFCLMAHPIRELSSMTLGVVGYGELGRGVARIATAFGMEILISARPGTDSVPADRVSFDELLRRADVVSLHCPLTPDTAGLIGANELDAMKSDAILINTARGDLIESATLVAALENGTIAGAAIDVLPQEPPVDGNPLLEYSGSNLMVTPHIAWGTLTARQAAIEQLANCVHAFLDGEELNRIV